MAKRLFDIFFSGLGLLLLCPFFLAIAVAVKLDSAGPVFFRQERMGMNFRPFKIFKFRTMRHSAKPEGPEITSAGDSRVTRAGWILRKYKLDEFPQLINVLVGEMSLVGPRPEVRKYAELFRDDFAVLLSVRPGMTDPASIAFRREEEILAAGGDWEAQYATRVLPEKIRLSREYIGRQGVLTDVCIILKTLRII